jgi:hypothetical protein
MLSDRGIKDTYISFTTYEARVTKMGPMLSALLNQWPADRVILTVAHDLELPTFVEDSGLNIVRSVDYGPFKKHSPLYMNLGIQQYIVVDDDCTFPNGWFDNLLRWSNRLPGQVVCGKGRIWRPANTLHYPNSKPINARHTIRPVPCHIYVGFAAALFRVDFFEPDVFPYPEKSLDYSDDIWFSAKLKDEVKIYVVPYCKDEYHEESGRPRQLSYAKEKSSRWKKARANGFFDKDVALYNHRSKILRRACCLV